MAHSDMRQKIMAAARPRVQARGYNALSFREIAKEVGIKDASVHYHFPTKGDLGEALASQYADDAQIMFDAMLASVQPVGDVFKTYTDIFRSALLNDNRMCLCGIMAAEYDDLPEQVRVQVNRFTQINVTWLSTMLLRLYPEWNLEKTEKQSVAIFAAIEGAQLVARSRHDVSAFDDSIEAYRCSGLIPR